MVAQAGGLQRPFGELAFEMGLEEGGQPVVLALGGRQVRRRARSSSRQGQGKQTECRMQFSRGQSIRPSA